MSDIYTKLQLDLTGKSANNLVSAEKHTLATIANFPYKMITLEHGGFYDQNLQVFDSAYNKLTPYVDYIITYNFKATSQYVGIKICGGIVFLDKTRTGDVYVQAQMVGGDLAFSLTVIQDYVTFYKAQTASYVPQWMDYNGNEPKWSPGELDQERWGLDTYQPFNNEIYNISKAYSGATGDWESQYRQKIIDDYNTFMGTFTSTLTNHLNDFGNPHKDIKDQIGLAQVANYALATTAQAQAGTRNDLYLTPALAAAEITALAVAPLNAHINSTGNVHNTTPAQLSTMTKAQVDTLKNSKYSITDTVAGTYQGNYNGNKSYAEIYNLIRTNMPAGNFAYGQGDLYGYIAPQRIGRGLPTATTVMRETGVWQEINDLMLEFGGAGGSGVMVMTFGNITPAAAHALATTTDWAYSAGPGSVILYQLQQTLTWGAGNGTDTQTYTTTYGSCKSDSGWVQL